MAKKSQYTTIYLGSWPINKQAAAYRYNTYFTERVVWCFDDDDSFWQPVRKEAVPFRDTLYTYIKNTIRTHRHALAKITILMPWYFILLMVILIVWCHYNYNCLGN